MPRPSRNMDKNLEHGEFDLGRVSQSCLNRKGFKFPNVLLNDLKLVSKQLIHRTALHISVILIAVFSY